MRLTELQAKRLQAKRGKTLPPRNVPKSAVTGPVQVSLKPLSVNDAWKGQRFRSDQYNQYESDCFVLLPAAVAIPDGPLKVEYEFGFSNDGSDYDNPIKPLQDILQKKYGFNDSRIVEANIKKVLVKKGHEYFKFAIMEAA